MKTGTGTKMRMRMKTTRRMKTSQTPLCLGHVSREAVPLKGQLDTNYNFESSLTSIVARQVAHTTPDDGADQP